MAFLIKLTILVALIAILVQKCYFVQGNLFKGIDNKTIQKIGNFKVAPSVYTCSILMFLVSMSSCDLLILQNFEFSSTNIYHCLLSAEKKSFIGK